MSLKTVTPIQSNPFQDLEGISPATLKTREFPMQLQPKNLWEKRGISTSPNHPDTLRNLLANFLQPQKSSIPRPGAAIGFKCSRIFGGWHWKHTKIRQHYSEIAHRKLSSFAPVIETLLLPSFKYKSLGWWTSILVTSETCIDPYTNMAIWQFDIL